MFGDGFAEMVCMHCALATILQVVGWIVFAEMICMQAPDHHLLARHTGQPALATINPTRAGTLRTDRPAGGTWQRDGQG